METENTVEEEETIIVPTGSTHLGPYGYVKQKGQFWYIFKEGGWLALSGKPVGALYPLKGETLGKSTPKD